MRCQADFLLPLKLQKISCYFGLCSKILLDKPFAGSFTFHLFDLLILIPGVHCYIVLAIFIIIFFLYLTLVKIHLNDKTNCKRHSLQLCLYTPN